MYNAHRYCILSKLGFENPALQIVPIKKKIVAGEWHMHMQGTLFHNTPKSFGLKPAFALPILEQLLTDNFHVPFRNQKISSPSSLLIA